MFILFVMLLSIAGAENLNTKNGVIFEFKNTNFLKQNSNQNRCSEQEANKTLSNIQTVEDFHNYALSVFSPEALRYYELGAMAQNTIRENVEAFKRYRLRPRMLRNVKVRKMCTKLFDCKLSMPIGIAPTALQKLASRDGELDTARAAFRAKTLMILSTFSTTSLEEVHAAAPEGCRWHQIYVFTNRSVTEDIIRRAEENNYKALVLTVDTPLFGRSIEKDYLTLPPGLNYGNLQKYLPPNTTDVFRYLTLDTSLTWDIIRWIKSISKLPVVVKGVLTGDDAKTAVSFGADAVYVSNHGGRQLDNVPATIEALPEIVRALQGMNVGIYMDSGIRNGSDVLEALAMGAKACFIGKPNLWGLSACGDQGAERVLERLRNELDLSMALSGVTSTKNVPKELVVREKYYDRIAP